MMGGVVVDLEDAWLTFSLLFLWGLNAVILVGLHGSSGRRQVAVVDAENQPVKICLFYLACPVPQ